MNHPNDHSLFGLGLPGYTLNYHVQSLQCETIEVIEHGNSMQG